MLTSFPSRSASNPTGSILCPTDITRGLGFGIWDLSSLGMLALIFVSKISSVFEIFPVNSISMKSFLFIVIIGFCDVGF